MVLNEPLAFSSLGYMVGIHAPGKKGLENFLPAVHYAALCQAEAGRLIRSNIADANIGTTFSVSPIEPLKDKRKHRKAAKRMDALFNRLFIEPALGMGYPVDKLPFLKRITERYAQPGDMEKLSFDFDFYGIQNYFPLVAKRSLAAPLLWANEASAARRQVHDPKRLKFYQDYLAQALRAKKEGVPLEGYFC